MAYCAAERCHQPKKEWSTCQQKCNAAHMQVADVNFIDYANCMARCSPVPVSPWGASATANATRA